MSVNLPTVVFRRADGRDRDAETTADKMAVGVLVFDISHRESSCTLQIPVLT